MTETEKRRRKKEKQLRRRNRRKRLLSAGMLAIFLFFAYGARGQLSELIQKQFQDSPIQAFFQEIQASEVNSEEYEILQKSKTDIGKGSLILVNSDLPYRFGMDDQLVDVSEEKNGVYRLSKEQTLLNKKALKAFNGMMLDFFNEEGSDRTTIISGFRSSEYQEKLLKTKIRQVGEKEARKWVAAPNFSEHHTGLAMDLGSCGEDGIPRCFESSSSCVWINEHCGSYGFIKRYDGSKETVTGIFDEPWHFRYVGVPHSDIMEEKGFCLEEYIGYLKGFQYEKKHLRYQDKKGKEYEIYYVKAEKGRTKTKVPVPKSGSYTISGNNEDGFIVTMERR